MFLPLSILFSILFLSTTHSEFVSVPSTEQWIQYSNITMHPSEDPFYEIVIHDNSTSFTVQADMCSNVDEDEDGLPYCNVHLANCLSIAIEILLYRCSYFRNPMSCIK